MGFTTVDNYLTTIADNKSGQQTRVAFFDLDGTLIAGYSIIAMALETARRGAQRGKWSESLSLIRDVVKHKAAAGGGGGNYHRLVRRLTKALAGYSEESLQELGYQAYRNSLAKSLYREAIALVEAHREAGHHLAIVTSASHYQAAPIARVLGIEEICCTKMVVKDGKFNGQVVTPMCYGEGKTMAARKVVKRLRSNLKRCYFYSDSSADLPLLREVGFPVVVNPSSRLAKYAEERDWPQLFFETRGMPSFESLLRTGLTAQTLVATALIGAAGNRLGMAEDKNANMLTRMIGDVGSGIAGLDFEVEGLENLKRSGPAIFIFNHQSLLDAFVLAHLLREDVVAFCKKEVADTPLLGPLMRQIETIFVDREDKNQSAVLQQALEVLDSGRSLVIAPEGTRSTLGNVQAFKHGAFFLARKARVPIVPIVLHNVKDALPKGGLVIRPATIRVTVLPPMHAADLGSVKNACQQLEALYIEHLGKSKLTALPFEANV